MKNSFDIYNHRKLIEEAEFSRSSKTEPKKRIETKISKSHPSLLKKAVF